MRLLSTILMFALFTPALAADALDTKVLAGLPNMSFHAPNFVAAGRLEPADIEKLASAGIRDVIDLSDDEETPDFDEAAAVSAAGMTYNNLPIDGANGLTEENVARFDRLMNGVGMAPTLVHCGSGNRVGALIALRAATLHGQPVEAAIALGRDWGLKGLEPAVREQLTGAKDSQAGAVASAKATLLYPRIALAGGAYALADGAQMPSAQAEHRLVIDARSDEANAEGLNRRLEAAARALNLYALAKVPADKLRVAVVLHGKATAVALDDTAHQRAFAKPNPNATLIAALHEAGVEFFLCGQAMTHAGYASTDIRSDVQVALSAMTELADLQAAGYALIP